MVGLQLGIGVSGFGPALLAPIAIAVFNGIVAVLLGAIGIQLGADFTFVVPAPVLILAGRLHQGIADQRHPNYCPNCGRLNEDDVPWNVLQINESSKYKPPTQEDIRYMAGAKRNVDHASRQLAKIDMRIPLEIWASRTG